MTSTVPPSAAPFPTPPLRVTDPADLVAAVPALLGFRPRESLVLISLGGPSGRRIGLTLRVDLPPPEPVEQVRAVAEHAAACLGADDPDGAAVIVVCESGPDAVGAGVAAAAVDALEDHGVCVRAAVWVERVAAGARWACFGACRCTGALPDPGSTPAALAAVVDGQVIHADRADLERQVQPADPVRIRRREQALIRAADSALHGPDPGGADDADDAHLAVVQRAVADAARGALELDDARVLALAAALVRRPVRDAVLVRCAQSSAERVAGRGSGTGGWSAAETVWAALCRELPDPEAAEAAALLAATALLRGDGALANVALRRAERSWPGHRLTGLLRSAAELAMSPTQIRECVLGSATP